MTASDDERISYLTGDEVAGPLTAAERATLDELRAVLATPATWAEPDPALEDRVVAAIGAQTAAEVAAVRSPAQPRGRRRLTLRIPRPAFALGGLSTVAVAVAAAVVIAVSSSGGGPALERFTMVVSGPGAHGAAQLTKMESGWQIKLSARGLPHLANGLYYEAWLKNAARVLVPVGTFNDPRHVTLWAGVPVTKFPTLTVTRQRVGEATSSGQRVLFGTIVRPHRRG